MSDWGSVGPHRYRLEDGLLHWQPHGPLTAEHALELAEVTSEMFRERGRIWALVDSRHGTGPTPAARQAMTQYLKAHNAHTVIAVYGHNFALRILITLIANAIRLLSNINPQLGFFDTEEEARVWLVGHRSP